MSDNVIKIGELLVRAGIVTGVDLLEAEKLAKHMSLQFGQVLIMSGCLSEHDLDCSLVAQQLIREELLTVDVACQALSVASQHQMPFEDALEALHVVPNFGTASVEMAELLADAAIIPGEMLEHALMTSLTANVSLGDLLVKENAISSSLIPVLNMMLSDVSSGRVTAPDAINEIRKNHFSWRHSQESIRPIPANPSGRPTDGLPAAQPVFVSQELMHAYEHYEPQQATVASDETTKAGSEQGDYANQSSAHSINDVLSKFAQKNPTAPGGNPPAPHEQQVASWNAFVQSQSFDPNDVEALVPPLSVADEPRLKNPEEPNRPVEVVQGTFSKTFDMKNADPLEDSFEPLVAPDFEPAPDVIEELREQEGLLPEESMSDGCLHEETLHNQVFQSPPEPEEEPEPQYEQFSLIVELLIASNHFDREDIVVAVTDALKDESRAIRLIEALGLADGKALMAASICSDAVLKTDLTPGEAVHVLNDIKGGAEIHEALEAVNLELAVTVSADLQAMFDDEIDENFYVGDVSRNVEVFGNDDFAYDPEVVTRKKAAELIVESAPQSSAEPAVQPAVEVAIEPVIQTVTDSVVESAIKPVTEALDVAPPKDDTPSIAFGYGRERLKIAKKRDLEAASTPRTEPVQETPTVQEVEPVKAAPGTHDNRRERPFAKDVLAKGRKAQEAVAEARKAQEARRTQVSQPAAAFVLPESADPVDVPTLGDKLVDAEDLQSVQEVDGEKKIRKRNSTTFNSLQAIFVPPPDATAVDEPAIPVLEALHVEPVVGNAPSDEAVAHVDSGFAAEAESNQSASEVKDAEIEVESEPVEKESANGKKPKGAPKAKVRGGAKNSGGGKKAKKRK